MKPGHEEKNTHTVTLSMTNTTFLAAFDAVCEQAGWRWGFRQRILMILSNKVFEEEQTMLRDEKEQANTRQ